MSKGGSLKMNQVEKLPPKVFEVQPFNPAKTYGTDVVNGASDYSFASAGGSINHVNFSYNPARKGKSKKGGARLII
ncbi:MAG: hypothetical protein K2P99_00050 [Burkholderiales bacterium]|nr:hypothetical protein [Burkholderiales bacterium]